MYETIKVLKSVPHVSDAEGSVAMPGARAECVPLALTPRLLGTSWAAGTAWHILLAQPPAHPKGSPHSPAALPRGIPRRMASPVSLCHMQNSQILARRSQANLVMGQLSRLFKINQNPGRSESPSLSHAVKCVNGQLRDGHMHGHHN